MCVIQLVVAVICGVISAAISSSKGRNPAGWFFVGFLTGIIGIIIVCCMSNRNEELARQQYVDMEQRRLREQLRQEQLKIEAMRQYSQARLDAHDQALGMDTRPVSALPGYQPQPQSYALTGDDSGGANLATSAPQQYQMPDMGVSPTQWYYECEGTTFGPVPESAIHMLLKSGRLSGSTLVWCQEFTEWTAASSVQIFRPSVIS